MGYYTNFTLTAYEYKIFRQSYSTTPISEEKQKILKADFNKLGIFDLDTCDEHENFQSGFHFRSTWESWEKDMIPLSAAHPEVCFCLHGEGDERLDLWNAYFTYGRGATDWAEVVYEEFNPIDLSGPENDFQKPYTCYEDVFAEMGWNCAHLSDGTILLENYSPAGEDYCFYIVGKNIPEEVVKHAENFDVDEHVVLWIDARGTTGVPSSIQELLDDANAIQAMLNDLAEMLHCIKLIPFYGKSCNYAFSFSKDADYDVFFVRDEEDRTKDICDLISNHYNSVDTCILWAGHYLFSLSEDNFNWEKIQIQNDDAEMEMVFTSQDQLVEAMWQTLTDVNIDDEECTEQDWFEFRAGTPRDDIWHWFDKHHSKGIGWLMNEFEGEE